jgi:hypothetical protein
MVFHRTFGMFTKNQKKPPPNQILKYSSGQLIIKEGDYGASVYRVAKGKVRIFKELQWGKAIINELGEDEIFGEMAFIGGGIAPHSTSAEAVGEVVLEIWHTLSIREDFQAASPIVRILAERLLNKLAKTNLVYERLFTEQQEKKENGPASPRDDLRKSWESTCKYRPLRGHTGRLLDGFVQEIGREDIRMMVAEHILLQVDHAPGSKFEMFLNFPDEDPLMVHGEILPGARGDTPGYRAFSFQFIHLTESTRNRIESFIGS